ncbi:hypothetical protein OV208_22690 [Corallococcus sp. bb12-1]|uniref:hypothetical protein n=1 Tax=Corallococcus sp. bb12-1 TaxID=2996784 RepID=UPI00226FBCC3|nr:hypothetical protein [Corallococcus sp. bb12-1]MCY1044143.1 hypothetical protein [Corallococcus sp. bb12-1]
MNSQEGFVVDDYSKDAANIVKVVFPEAKAQEDGTWVQEWRIRTVGAVNLVSDDDLARLGQSLSQPDFWVQPVRSPAGDSFVLRVVMFSDAKQGRFLLHSYGMLRFFDEHFARIAFVEDRPRNDWSALRAWPSQE